MDIISSLPTSKSQKVGLAGEKLNNMKNYLVRIKCYLPYPIEKEYRIEANGLGTAANRGIKKYRKDINGKRIRELTLQIIKL